MLRHTLLLLFISATFALSAFAQTATPPKTTTSKKSKGKSPAQLTSAYIPKVKAALRARWAGAVTERMSEFSPGNIDVTFKLDAGGKVTDFAVKQNTSNEPFAKFCDQFVRETKFDAPPAGALTDGQIEIPFTFTIL